MSSKSGLQFNQIHPKPLMGVAFIDKASSLMGVVMPVSRAQKRNAKQGRPIFA
ncbi:hypothetical protein [Pediococcus parvulus]|uniref:hypothetical protein n=1 Tax=Pediococcus parvulus TaxID=54062 RepID=UPI001649E1AA|nr:hypothetical protein [Pediococcus parvulus]